MREKIVSILEKSFMGDWYRRFIRRSRGGVIAKRTKSSNSKNQFKAFFSSIFSFIPKITKQSKYIFSGLIFLAILGIHLFQYFTINFKPYYSDVIPPIVYQSKDINTVVYTVSEVDSYKYIESITLVVGGNDAVRLVELSPYFNSERYSQTSLRTFLNEYSGDEPALIALNNAISAILGVRIDRYIYINSNVFDTNYLKLDRDLLEKIRNTDNFLTQSYTEDYAKFKESLFYKNSRLIPMYNLLWNKSKLYQYIKTDMNRPELVQFLSNFRVDKQINYKAIGVEQAVIKENAEKSLEFSPNYLIIDETLLGFVDDLDVVAEQAELEVYNASSTRGLASLYTREFQNIGMNVVKYGNYFEDEKETVLHLSSEDDLSTFRNSIKAIQQSLRSEVKIEIGKYPYNKTGNLILVLNK
ncbi:LytR C-terminal domain-containing protein [Candidatus Dojkabacteria bacterium]|uniref:LytR C-terminal domain-containing protein n=1 Tax=Candidatus Dojkabacteria bacterium TaxID=2099670 RepID=A0A955L215_9BACT|nr:LytR C-terminal domain-containing protein [Candidatus Dojkabacteria bacterium]